MYREEAVHLYDNGWQTIPTRGKEPFLPNSRIIGDYQTDRNTIETMAATAYPGANIGLPFGLGCSALSIDIDILDPEGAAALQQLTEKHLGPTPFIRVGRSPKVALFYRKDRRENWDYKTVHLPGFEVYAAGGSQMIIYGIHPVTKEPYQWTGTKEPLTHHPDELPTAHWPAIEQLIKEALPHLQKYYKPKTPTSPGMLTPAFVRKITGERSPLAGLTGWAYGQQLLLRLNEMEPGNRHETIKLIIGSMVARGYPDNKIRAVLEAGYVRRFSGDGTDRFRKITKLLGYYRQRAGGDFTNDLSSTRNNRQAHQTPQAPQVHQDQDQAERTEEHSHLAQLHLLQPRGPSIRA